MIQRELMSIYSQVCARRFRMRSVYCEEMAVTSNGCNCCEEMWWVHILDGCGFGSEFITLKNLLYFERNFDAQ